MRQLKMRLPAFFVCCLMGIGIAHAFSFDFGDDDDDYPYWRYWGPAYNPWMAPPPYAYYPRLRSFDRSTMVRNRQRSMDAHGTTMRRLHGILYGSSGFDRAQAIKLARKIEMTSGLVLTGNFHPGSVAAYRSNTTPALWGNEQAFRANAQALQATANALAKELEKQPSAEQGAVYLSTRRSRFDREKPGSVAVSPGIWEKYNALSNICVSCHRGFRGRDW